MNRRDFFSWTILELMVLNFMILKGILSFPTRVCKKKICSVKSSILINRAVTIIMGKENVRANKENPISKRRFNII